jgi:hypothetical protein
MAGLAPKGSKSTQNKEAKKSSYYKPKNPIDKIVRKELSKPSNKGKVDGTLIRVASPKTVIKAENKARSRVVRGKK